MNWPMVKLGDVCTINPRLPKNVNPEQEVTFLAMSAVSEKGKISSQETRILHETKKGFTYFERGDVLLAKITPCFENGKATLTNNLNTQIGFGSTEFHVLRANPEKIIPEYLYYFVWNEKFRITAAKEMTGSAGQKRVSSDYLKNHKLYLPTVHEQRIIIKTLKKEHSILKKREKAIELSENLLRATFYSLYGNPIYNPKAWPVYRMDDIIEFKGGHQPPKSEFISAPKEGYIRLVQIRDFKTEKYACYIPIEKAKRLFDTDDVMIARYGPPVFQILRGMSGSYNVALMKASPKKGIRKDFIYYLLQLPEYHDVVVQNSERTAGQTGVNLDLLNKFNVPLPPIAVQDEIISVMIKIESLKHKMEKALIDSKKLFSANQGNLMMF